jgi:hypothetical protein
MQVDVVSLEHGVCLEFAAPVAITMLKGEKEVARSIDGRLNIRQVRIKTAKSGRRGLLLPLFYIHAI